MSPPHDFADLFPPLAWEMPIALLAFDGGGVLRYANPAAGSLLAGPAARFVGRAWSDFVRGSEFPPRLPCEVSLCRETGDTMTVRLKPCAQGPADLSAFYAEPESAVASSIADLQRLRLLIDHNPDYILTVGRDLKVRDCNRVTPPLTREQVIGSDILSYVDPPTQALLLAKYHEVWNTGRPADIETPVPIDGKVHWYLTRLVPLPDPDFGPDGLLMVAHDITDLKNTERALRESEARFRQIGEAIEDILWITDFAEGDTPVGRITYISRAADDIWGIPRERLMTEPRIWIDMTHPEDRERVLQFNADMAASDANRFEIELHIIRPDGEIRHLHSAGVVMRNEHGVRYRVFGVVRDITARKKLEENQALLQRRLQEARHLESLGVLAGGIAHDFNNLLSGILGNVNLAQFDAAPDSSLRGYLDAIERKSLRAADLCKQMHAYAGKSRPRPGAVDLGALLDEVAKVVSLSLPASLKLLVECTAKSPPVPGDFAQLRQAVINLVLNAEESFESGSGTVRLTAGLATIAPVADGIAKAKEARDAEPDRTHGLSEANLAPGVYATIEVSDDGPGMTPDVLARVFEPFFTTKFPGRGLGLAAVHGIVRGHRGAIRVASAPGSGTRFTILLPTAE